MGIEPFLIAYAINIIVAQRLVRTLCNACKRPVPKKEIDHDIYRKFGFTEENFDGCAICEATGCEKCSAGYKGRAAIQEALYFTKEIRSLIVKSGVEVDEEAIRAQATKDGMWTLRRSGIERIKSGMTTLEEIAAVTTDD
jgi:type IV pilus assembly protein PilB